ncbi:MAG: 2-O-methyltransferase NoeI [Candidatus Anoxychlamydiales bacterium]|nr:2-O-methyltransferase NoeI [Candidatus Anoxychlamydiales bacterium]
MKKYLLILFLCFQQVVCYTFENSQNDKLRILVGSPIHQTPAILKEFLNSLNHLEKNTFTLDYFFVDDNDIEESSQMLKDFSQKLDQNSNALIFSKKNDSNYHCDEFTHHWNKKSIWKVAKFKDLMIKKALIENYDYLFLIDSDLVLYPKTIEQLLIAKKDIISNIFWTKWTPDSELRPQVWLTDNYTMYKKEISEDLTQKEINKRIYDFLNRLKDPGVYEVGGLGACTLISQAALKKGISFEQIKNFSYFLGEDRHFCIRATILGLPLFVDTHYPAYHIYRESYLAGVEDFKKNCGISNLSNSNKFFQNYPIFQKVNIDKSRLWYFMESCSPGKYLEPCFLKHIDKNNVSSILEIGSRDLIDAVDLSEYYKCHVFTFECNPECLDVCKTNDKVSPNVTLVEKAAWEVTETISFYPTIHTEGKVSDPGLSSCFNMTEKTLTQYGQKYIEVPAIRIDQWLQEENFENIDMICMNTNGAALNILKGLGSFLEKTKYIITDCKTSYDYESECLLYEIVEFLKDKYFEIIPTEMENDYLFVNKKLISSVSVVEDDAPEINGLKKTFSNQKTYNNNSELDSRFFLITDEQTKSMEGIPFPKYWWSRPFEYKWASKFTGQEYTVLDAGCGITHPFKWYLGNTCSKAWACDIDPQILDYETIMKQTKSDFGQDAYDIMYENIHQWMKVNLVCSSICSLPNYMPMFDRIFCISMLEHLSNDEMKQTLKEFAKKLSSKGLLVITVDYPTIHPKKLLEIAASEGLIPAGNIELGSPPKNAVNGNPYYPALYVYRCVLKHDKSF